MRSLFSLQVPCSLRRERAALRLCTLHDYFADTVEAFDSKTGDHLAVTATGLKGPAGMAFNSAGDLFVSDCSVNFITRITPNGASSVFATGLATPSGLAFDKTGNLFVANFWGNNIEKFTSNGVGSVFATGLNGPMGLAFDSAGNSLCGKLLRRHH